MDPEILWCDELRIYMGPKHGPVPRGAVVHLYAKVYAGRKRWWKMGFFEYNGMKLWAPIRCLWRINHGK